MSEHLFHPVANLFPLLLAPAAILPASTAQRIATLRDAT
jgi:hypothetical protein